VDLTDWDPMDQESKHDFLAALIQIWGINVLSIETVKAALSQIPKREQRYQSYVPLQRLISSVEGGAQHFVPQSQLQQIGTAGHQVPKMLSVPHMELKKTEQKIQPPASSQPKPIVLSVAKKLQPAFPSEAGKPHSLITVHEAGKPQPPGEAASETTTLPSSLQSALSSSETEKEEQPEQQRLSKPAPPPVPARQKQQSGSSSQAPPIVSSVPKKVQPVPQKSAQKKGQPGSVTSMIQAFNKVGKNFPPT